MLNTDIAYAAGAIDADGNITIKRSTQRVRNSSDCLRACYSPRISLGQVTPQVPEFLKRLFGGSIYITKPGTKNSRPLFKWSCSDRTAVASGKRLLPFLKIKKQQASALIELHQIRSNHNERKLATWYARENPNWATTDELLTTAETMRILGYTRHDMVAQAVAIGTLLVSHKGPCGRIAMPRIPKPLVLQLLASRSGNISARGRKGASAPQYVAAQQVIWERVRGLNKVGVHGTTVNHRTGYHTPAG